MYAFDAVARKLGPYQDRLLALPEPMKRQTFDIRFKLGQPVALCGREGIFFLGPGGAVRDYSPGLPAVTSAQMEELFLHICGYSVFSHEEELRRGYVSLGSCRAGVCGAAVGEGGRVRGVRDISSLVFRVPRDFPGCGDRLFQTGVDFSAGMLLTGEPSSGKTTLLRDLARSLSLGRFGPPRRVAVLDCRGELSGFDLGPCADVLRGFPKAQAFDMALRTLSPEIIVCDELAQEDLEAVGQAMFAGVGLAASVHASAAAPEERPLCRALLGTGAFQTLAVLQGRESPCRLASVRFLKEERAAPRHMRAGA